MNSAGYDVTTATEATEARELAKNLSIDAYVLDNMMPGSSGIDLCRRIRENDPSTPIFFYSGYDDRKEALKAKAQAYILKPHFEELTKEIDSYLRPRVANSRTKLNKQQTDNTWT